MVQLHSYMVPAISTFGAQISWKLCHFPCIQKRRMRHASWEFTDSKGSSRVFFVLGLPWCHRSIVLWSCLWSICVHQVFWWPLFTSDTSPTSWQYLSLFSGAFCKEWGAYESDHGHILRGWFKHSFTYTYIYIIYIWHIAILMLQQLIRGPPRMEQNHRAALQTNTEAWLDQSQ